LPRPPSPNQRAYASPQHADRPPSNPHQRTHAIPLNLERPPSNPSHPHQRTHAIPQQLDRPPSNPVQRAHAVPLNLDRPPSNPSNSHLRAHAVPLNQDRPPSNPSNLQQRPQHSPRDRAPTNTLQAIPTYQLQSNHHQTTHQASRAEELYGDPHATSRREDTQASSPYGHRSRDPNSSSRREERQTTPHAYRSTSSSTPEEHRPSPLQPRHSDGDCRPSPVEHRTLVDPHRTSPSSYPFRISGTPPGLYRPSGEHPGSYRPPGERSGNYKVPGDHRALGDDGDSSGRHKSPGERTGSYRPSSEYPGNYKPPSEHSRNYKPPGEHSGSYRPTSEYHGSYRAPSEHSRSYPVGSDYSSRPGSAGNQRISSRSPLNDGPVTCHICNLQLQNQIVFQQHLAGHVKPRPYICRHCDAGFSTVHQLNSHVALHK